jgi:hypothetical protein
VKQKGINLFSSIKFPPETLKVRNRINASIKNKRKTKKVKTALFFKKKNLFRIWVKKNINSLKKAYNPITPPEKTSNRKPNHNDNMLPGMGFW